MAISVGESIPAVKVMQATAEGPKEVDTGEFFKGRTVALFGVPGAFTPTCSAKHLPSFADNAAALKAKGYDYRYIFSKNTKHCDGKVFSQTLADTLVWMWKGYKPE